MAEQEAAAAARAQSAKSAEGTLPPQSEVGEKNLKSAKIPNQHTASTESTVQAATGTTTIADIETVTETQSNAGTGKADDENKVTPC